MPKPFMTVDIKGFNDATNQLKLLEGRVVGLMHNFIFGLVSHVAERAVPNAPILTGALRADITGEKDGAVITKGIGGGATISKKLTTSGRVFNSVSIPYSLAMHEAMYKLGPISSMQPPTSEGGVGRKYFTRVIQYHQKKYKEVLRKEVKKISVRGAKVTGKIRIT